MANSVGSEGSRCLQQSVAEQVRVRQNNQGGLGSVAPGQYPAIIGAGLEALRLSSPAPERALASGLIFIWKSVYSDFHM
jgi:hypothetical protein